MEERGTWWREAKFGMFIHWGLYALLAGSYAGRESGGNAEWIMHDLHIPPEEYRTLAGRFDPVDFDADAIVRLCREAGMRITTASPCTIPTRAATTSWTRRPLAGTWPWN